MVNIPPRPAFGMSGFEDTLKRGHRTGHQAVRETGVFRDALRTAAIALVFLGSWALELQLTAAPPRPHEVIFTAGFDEANALAGWSGRGQLAPGAQGGSSVEIENTNAASGALLSRRLPVEKLRGSILRGTATIRAEGVSAKPNSWNGIKFMLVIETPSGKDYPQAPLGVGSFGWKTANVRAHVPADATNVTLVLGLERVTGKVFFDDVKMAKTASTTPTDSKPIAGPMYKGHSLPRLRGTMVSPNVNAESLRVLGQEWNANLIRFQIIRNGGRPDQRADLSNYDSWLDGELRKLDALLPACEKYGLMVALDLHSPPGGKATVSGYFGSDDRLFTSREAQDKFVEVWKRIATRYKNSKMIWGYDLANEPVEDDVAEDCDDWRGLAERAALAIRAIDPIRTLIVEPAGWGSPDGLNTFSPLNVSNVVYSVHMYIPHQFSHQGVFDNSPAYVYPGLIAGKNWDKSELERPLRPAIDFQRRFNVQIYIGEFSAIRWAPRNSAASYLSDLIAIFEDHGWEWSYHAFREWQGWSVEHGENRKDTQPASTPTDREKLLRGWFSRNAKPK